MILTRRRRGPFVFDMELFEQGSRKAPEDMEPSELVKELVAEGLPHDVFDYPRLKSDGTPVGRVRMQLVSREMEAEAELRALDSLRKDPRVTDEILDSAPVQELLADRKAREVLAMVCLSTVNKGSADKPFYPRLFGNPKILEKHATSDEILFMWRNYEILRVKCGIWHMDNVNSEKAVAFWAKKLEDAESIAPLLSLVPQDLAILASHSLQTVRLLSRVLASLRESLPTSLESDLAIFMEGITSSGESQDIGSSKSGEKHGNEPQGNQPETKDLVKQLSAQLADEERSITHEEAIEIVKDRKL